MCPATQPGCSHPQAWKGAEAETRRHCQGVNFSSPHCPFNEANVRQILRVGLPKHRFRSLQGATRRSGTASPAAETEFITERMAGENGAPFLREWVNRDFLGFASEIARDLEPGVVPCPVRILGEPAGGFPRPPGSISSPPGTVEQANQRPKTKYNRSASTMKFTRTPMAIRRKVFRS